MPDERAAESPRIPTTAEEALEIGRREFPEVWPDGRTATLHVHEFDIGYLVYARFPAPSDPTTPPPAGGSNIVISKHDGEITAVPNYPVETAVETYRRFYHPSTPPSST